MSRSPAYLGAGSRLLAATFVALLTLAALTVPAASAKQQKALRGIGGYSGGDSAPLGRKARAKLFARDFLRGRPHISSVRVFRLKTGRDSSRLQIQAVVRYPKLRSQWARLLSDEASYGSNLDVAIKRAGPRAQEVRAGKFEALPLGSSRQGGRVVQRLMLSSADSRRLGGGDLLVTQLRATARFDQFGDGKPEAKVARRVRMLRIHTLQARAAADDRVYPCSGAADLEPYKPSGPPGDPPVHLVYQKLNIPVHFAAGPIKFRLCVWSGEPLSRFSDFIFYARGEPKHGSFSDPRIEDGYVTSTYTPDPNATGSEDLRFFVDGDGGGQGIDQFHIFMYFRPFEMRATGDSVTAGWGYLGDGRPPQISGDDRDFDFFRMLDCSPDDGAYANQCSSNSSGGPADNNPAHRFNDDTGLKNNVSWAAQFANRHGIGFRSRDDQYATYGNYAVSGGRPEHYVQGGLLYGNPFVEKIINYDPDLTVMTLGANPLLSKIIRDRPYEDKCGGGVKNLEVRQQLVRADRCMDELMDQEHVYTRLRAVYRALLDDPHNRIFVAHYPLSYPSLASYQVTTLLVNRYAPYVIEEMVNRLNAKIDEAVRDEAADARSHGKGDRLFVFDAPRFNLGMPGLAQVFNNKPGVTCPSNPNSAQIDGPSKQSAFTQFVLGPRSICGSGDYWFESLDSGLHLSKTGATQFANALDDAIKAHGIALPPPGSG